MSNSNDRTTDAERARQRWIVADAIRDGRWRSIEQINELVGFDAEPALMEEERGAKNFQRVGLRWKMKPEAVRCLEGCEQRPADPRPKPRAMPKARKRKARKKKQRKLFR